ncbi:twin-arginine translocase subunit TatC [Niallia nealsonii]|uniref:Sec-independent protein translocase protein TatC n=1 Tax=Niallia nealsonii TaxID=115979 RepID=A0A2N0YZM0_9BACI|nr:twin-arginine translocase subunit TatC [Niallia nealsonii]PKG22706.1 twin-arginine translocase subunit TatC [Niallia nealsonii]
MNDQSVSLSVHLKELRTRIIIIAISFFFAFIIGMLIAKPLILWLKKDDMPVQVTFNVFKVTDAFHIYMQVAFILALILIAPIILYQLWGFVKPGLHQHEQKTALYYIPIIFCLFLIGILFSYTIVFPFALKFMFQFGEDLGVKNTIGLNTYFQFMMQLVLPFGALFQMPILIAFLTKLQLLSPSTMKKCRKYAYFVILIIAGLIAPPEVLSQLLITVPLLILYEISIFVSSFVTRKIERKELIA